MGIKSGRIERAAAGLLAVDLQERLLPAIDDRENLLANVVRLLRGAVLIKLPVWLTEQYPKGLGGTVSEVRAAVDGMPALEKLTFSACGADGLTGQLAARGISGVVLCGIEAHVCVLQSCLDLLDSGRAVYVVADAISSRTSDNRGLAIERMRQAGAVIVSTEMILFELMGTAGAPEFKELQRLVK
jgi:nicotinamidase-related amidase